jgi:hypothetical protein
MKVGPCVPNYPYAKFSEFWISKRSPIRISKCRCLKILINKKMLGPPVSLSGRLNGAQALASRTRNSYVAATATSCRRCRPAATSAPRAAHAAAARASPVALSVRGRRRPSSSHNGRRTTPLYSALLSPSPPFPTTPLSSEPGNRTPTFPSPRRTPLELTPWTSGPGASSSLATASSASPSTVDHRVQCSSNPVDLISSVARALRCSPTSPTEPTTADRPPHQRTPPPDRHRRHNRALVSLLPPFAPNRDRHRPSLLPGRFPTDQWLPADRIWPMSCRRRGECPPCFIGHGPKYPRGLGRLAEQAEPCCGLSPSALFQLSFDLF